MIETRLETFQAWVLFFSESELPVLRRTIDELARLKANEDNITSRDIANAAARSADVAESAALSAGTPQTEPDHRHHHRQPCGDDARHYAVF
jgi:hypothetical protein